MHFDQRVVFWQYNIRTPGKARYVKTIPQPLAVQGTSQF
jgi:hypothetical protein